MPWPPTRVFRWFRGSVRAAACRAEAGFQTRRIALVPRAWPPCLRNWTSSGSASTRFGGPFDIDRKRSRVELIERESVQPGFWDDQKRAQALSKEKSGLERSIGLYVRERQRLEDAAALWELAEEANDEATRAEAKTAVAHAGAGRLELAKMLSGPQDHLNAIVEINAGAGGTESQDWAAMLYRMYSRFCERKGWEVRSEEHTSELQS